LPPLPIVALARESHAALAAVDEAFLALAQCVQICDIVHRYPLCN
jgi:hypothetical protein